MATADEVNVGLRKISDEINAVRTRFVSAKSSIEGGSAALGSMPTKWADVLATIDGYSGADASELFAKAEKARLVAEYVALKNDIDILIAEF